MKTKLITITLVSLATVLVTVPFFTAQAYFSDTERSLFIFSTSDFSSSQHLSGPEQPSSTTTTVTLSAGIIDIAVNGQNPWAETYEFTSMTPGLWGETDINIANIGNNPVTYKISAEWDSSSSPSSQYLFDALQVEIFDARGNLITSVDQFLKDLDTPSHFLTASGEELLKFKVKLRDDAGTEYQNLITKFNLIIIATQIIDRNALIVEFEGAPLFNEANFSPGQSVTRWVKVTNNSAQIQRIATEAINVSDPNRLGDVLNLEIKEGGVTRYNKPLSTFFNEGEVYLSDLAPGSSTLYNFSISFYPEASNVFQGKSLSFDILVGFQGISSGGAGGYFSDAEVSSGNTFTAGTWETPVGKTLSEKAVALAISVIGAPYLGDGVTWGGKGWNSVRYVETNEIHEGYQYWNNQFKAYLFDKGLDCSGLSFWSFNKANDAEHYVYPEPGLCPECPIGYEKANTQYRKNTNPISKNDLMPGDLLFYNESKNIDEVLTHVMLYTGNFNYNEENYNVIHAMLDTKKISPALYDVNEEKLTTLGSNKVLNIVAYGRLKKPDTNGVYWYIMNSPASMIVTDPDDEIVDKNNPESVSMEYFYYNVDNDEEIEDVVMVTTRKQGEYKIQVVPNDNASPTDTFTLEIKTSTSTIMLAENIPIEDIPDQPYVIRVTETEIIPVIPATIDCDPDTLNLKSNGKWIPCYIELSAGYDVWQIDGSTIILNEVISAYLGKEGWAKSESNKSNIMDHDGDGILERMVKFDRSNIQAILSPEERIPIILAGKVFHNGIYIEFKGSDVIRVIK